MVLRLYHFEKEPVTVYNVIKVAIDSDRQILVRTKERSDIKYQTFRHEIDYQRLTIAVD